MWQIPRLPPLHTHSFLGFYCIPQESKPLGEWPESSLELEHGVRCVAPVLFLIFSSSIAHSQRSLSPIYFLTKCKVFIWGCFPITSARLSESAIIIFHNGFAFLNRCECGLNWNRMGLKFSCVFDWSPFHLHPIFTLWLDRKWSPFKRGHTLQQEAKKNRMFCMGWGGVHSP